MDHSDFHKLVTGQLVYWQDLLKLRDWDIKVDYWPHDALENAVAKMKFSRNQKTATIALRVPEDIPPVERDWPDNEAVDYDMSLVHELIHLKCVELESKVEWAEEQLSNHLTRALVKLYRDGRNIEQVPVEGEPGQSAAIVGHHTGHYL